MAKSGKVDVYLEVGKKKVVAGAVEWPGWCRVGRDEQSALQALAEYGPRYKQVMSAAKIDFSPPDDGSGLNVAERLEGNATTDFGAPSISPKSTHAAAPMSTIATSAITPTAPSFARFCTILRLATRRPICQTIQPSTV